MNDDFESELMELLKSHNKTNIYELEIYISRILIKNIVESSSSMTHAASILGIGRSTLYRRIRDYGIQIENKT